MILISSVAECFLFLFFSVSAILLMLLYIHRDHKDHYCISISDGEPRMDTDFHIAPVSVGYVALALLSLSRCLACM